MIKFVLFCFIVSCVNGCSVNVQQIVGEISKEMEKIIGRHQLQEAVPWSIKIKRQTNQIPDHVMFAAHNYLQQIAASSHRQYQPRPRIQGRQNTGNIPLDAKSVLAPGTVIHTWNHKPIYFPNPDINSQSMNHRQAPGANLKMENIKVDYMNAGQRKNMNPNMEVRALADLPAFKPMSRIDEDVDEYGQGLIDIR